MSALKNIAGLLALGTALSGAAIALGGATAGTASAATVMGGYIPAPSGGVRYVRPSYNYNSNRQRQGHKALNRNKNKNKNKNHEWQHARQSENQSQFLLRDFTLVLTPFQKSSNGSAAVPWNAQWSQNSTIPTTNTSDYNQMHNRPWQDQSSQADPRTNTATQVNPQAKTKDVDVDVDADIKKKEEEKKEHAPRPEDITP
ncbi:hypothetical protein [Microbispora sp. NBRC 16548]|uniref:hypothetical protein n=1 Tax=Microbispora sp. NBRC 16548 TaxID=3030994 RepID=UPI00161F9BE6|nr:hypothetical protein [Microbispora sp. NBRC 16548]GLX08474.1 hypothetical protein Misp03_54000 [Microbispora sp. NBRC 16548]